MTKLIIFLALLLLGGCLLHSCVSDFPQKEQQDALPAELVENAPPQDANAPPEQDYKYERIYKLHRKLKGTDMMFAPIFLNN